MARGLIGHAYGMGEPPVDGGMEAGLPYTLPEGGAGVGNPGLALPEPAQAQAQLDGAGDLGRWLATTRRDYGIADADGDLPDTSPPQQPQPMQWGQNLGDLVATRSAATASPAERNDDPAPRLRISETMPGSPQASWKMGQPTRLFREEDRRQSILTGTPGSIVVEPNPSADGRKPLIERPAQEHVREHEALMDRIAAQYGVDPDLVKAIAYMETTHGWYDSFKRAVGQEKSIRPMNIHAEKWSGLGYSRNDLDDPEKNIDAGVRILKGIADRAENPSIRNVATLYNSLASDKVNDYGARVDQIYQSKPWRKQPSGR